MKRLGFTFIEVMVALAILAISFTSLIELRNFGIRMWNRTKYTIIATFLARDILIERENNLKGFSDFGEYEGTKYKVTKSPSSFKGFYQIRVEVSLNKDKIVSMEEHIKQ